MTTPMPVRGDSKWIILARHLWAGIKLAFKRAAIDALHQACYTALSRFKDIFASKIQKSNPAPDYINRAYGTTSSPHDTYRPVGTHPYGVPPVGPSPFDEFRGF